MKVLTYYYDIEPKSKELRRFGGPLFVGPTLEAIEWIIKEYFPHLHIE